MRIAILIALSLISLGCAPESAANREISPEQLLSMAAEPDSVFILDVRSPKEFAESHVPGAVNVPHDQVATRLGDLPDPDGRPVVVYCERGGRASRAEAVLMQAGFSDVRHLTGDMSAWREQGHPTE
jgi:phage shock protein E